MTGGLSDSSGKGSWRGEKKQQENRRQATAQESYLLVDGYNIILPGKICMNCQNIVWTLHGNKLMETLSNYQGYTSQRVILVFVPISGRISG